MPSDLTRAQITAKAADAMGRSLSAKTKSGATVQSILDEMYEWSQLRLARAWSFDELDVRDTTTADTTADVMTYSFSTLFGSGARVKDILSVVIEDGTSSVKLIRVLTRKARQRVPYPEGQITGKPVYYNRLGNNLELFPVADATYDIHTIRNDYPTRATGDTYQSQFEFKDDLLIVGTVIEFFNYYQEFSDAEKWDKIWKDKLKEMLDGTVHPTDWEPEGRGFSSAYLAPGDFWSNPLHGANTNSSYPYGYYGYW